MLKKLTTNELKQSNKRNLVNFIYTQRKTSKLEIAQKLGLSRPTITQLLDELFALKIIEKNGFYESTGGRKAEAITFVSLAKISIGVELRRAHYEIIAINLYGEIIQSQRIYCPFTHDLTYYKQVCQDVSSFISTLHISSRRILGIGIVLQGLISADGSTVTYGKILNCTGLTTDMFTQFLPYPCHMIHDAEAAALDELWELPSLKDAVFFHIRTNLSGAIIVNGDFLPGTNLKSGVFEHMTLIPDGQACYCGNKGCVDTYCSIDSLLHDDEILSDFFVKLRLGKVDYQERWLSYLQKLAMTVNNIHMFMDYDIILGGTLARYLNAHDLHLLHSYVNNRSAFPSDKEFIKISKTSHTPIAKGAALPFVKKYLIECV